MENSMTVFLGFRCTPDMKRRLEAIAERSVTSSLSDHIRLAVERYIEEHETTNQPVAQRG